MIDNFSKLLEDSLNKRDIKQLDLRELEKILSTLIYELRLILLS